MKGKISFIALFSNPYFLGGLVLLILLLYSWFKKKFVPDTGDVEDCENVTLTHPFQWYVNKVDSLKVAFGNDYDTTDEQAVYDVFSQLNNCADFNQLNLAWDRQDYYFASDFPFFPSQVTLEGVIQNEMNASEKAVLNDYLQNIGVDYRY